LHFRTAQSLRHEQQQIYFQLRLRLHYVVGRERLFGHPFVVHLFGRSAGHPFVVHPFDRASHHSFVVHPVVVRLGLASVAHSVPDLAVLDLAAQSQLLELG
jgi:hypothetical protein